MLIYFLSDFLVYHCTFSGFSHHPLSTYIVLNVHHPTYYLQMQSLLLSFVWLFSVRLFQSQQFSRREDLPPLGTDGIGTSLDGPSNGEQNSLPSTENVTTTQDTQQRLAPADINLIVLNFALTLENLETQFYQDALAIFPTQTMQKAGLSAFQLSHQASALIQQLQRQALDEQAHVQALQAAIKAAGATPFAGCQFNFRSVLSDPITFLASARSIEAAGVSAYAGAVSLITNTALLSTAATILPIEAKHASLFNLFSGGSASTHAFELPLSPPQVLAVLGGLLQDCKASDLGLTANQPLSVIDGVTQSNLFSTGSILQFQTSAQLENLQTSTLSCQILAGGATNAVVMPASSCIIPSQIAGTSLNGVIAIFLTSDAQPLSPHSVNEAKNVLAGPALVFVDSHQQDVLGQLFSLKRLNLKNLPTANLASAALTPLETNATQEHNSAPDEEISGSRFAKRELNESDHASSFKPTGMSNLGWSSVLEKETWSAIPKSVVQIPSQST
ncbi:hypothetical protein O181_032970 [Austropuccinia psidii MF-1]|uniref:Ferritin-like domain-containing protein n=1 Tax=Austropuccinia psidii MF-1 TaxID=1389203 RepID=A0A9Q3H8R4_9BASI|nr:hypothetical protein [Austropuccinia psidii MF-1]